MSMPTANQQPARRYKHAPRAIVFPTGADVPESKRHLEIRTALYAILKLALRSRAMIGSEQFVYWDPTDPSKCLAPDAFVRLGGPDERFDSWKTWERGAPHVAVEIVSRWDASEASWELKLPKYQRMGVSEVVRFDPEGGVLRIWEFVEGDLVERLLTPGEPAECVPLGLFWVVVPDEASDLGLRLARDKSGADLLPTVEELAQVARAETETARAELDVAVEKLQTLEREIAARR